MAKEADANNNSAESLNSIPLQAKIFFYTMSFILLIASRHSFIFFIEAMIPSFIAFTLDQKENKFSSAIICSFNIMGVMPHLFKLLNHDSVGIYSLYLVHNFTILIPIYFISAMGWAFLLIVPAVITKIYLAKASLRIQAFMRSKKSLCDQWGIEFKDDDAIEESEA